MSIRIRTREDGVPTVAVCAARSIAKPGDIYLDDGAHHALYVKFSLDIESERAAGLRHSYIGSEEEKAMEREESNNPNRAEWDAYFGNPDAAPPAKRS